MRCSQPLSQAEVLVGQGSFNGHPARVRWTVPVATVFAVLTALFGTTFASAGPGLPKPTFVVSFNGTTTPQVMAGRKDHPAAKAKGVKFVPGKKGQAVLLGDGPILVYHANGNIPDQATISFWIKPIDWKKLAAWRDLMVIRAAGRRTMMFSHYPGHRGDVQFTWSTFYGSEHKSTKGELNINEWNHVAIAWDGVRSRVYFNGKLVLSKNHPAGFRPEIVGITTLHLGGIDKGAGRGSYRGPWGEADTAYDELMVFPGALSAVQIAELAGQKKEAKPLAGPPDKPHVLDVPKLRRSPNLDGRLAEGEWAGAATIPTLIDGRNPGRSFDYPEQRIHFGYDDKNLYVAMRVNFPLGAKIIKAPLRNSLADKDVEVWSSESFELYLLKPGDKLPYRFAGSPGGGFTEFYKKDYSWNGEWTYKTTMGMTIRSTEYWDAEIAVPFKTLGIDRPEETELKLNFARTWRCLDEEGITSLAGTTGYGGVKHFTTVRFSPTGPGYSVKSVGSPALGKLEQTFVFTNSADQAYRGKFQVLLEAELAENNRLVQTVPLDVASKGSQKAEIVVPVDDPMFQRLRYTLTAKGGKQPQLRYSVPFALRTDFLDIVPLNLQHKLVTRPAYSLYRSYLRSQGKEDGKIMVRVSDSAGRKIAEREVTDDQEIWLDLSDKGPWGSYRVTLFAVDAAGNTVEPNDREFYRPETPVWMTVRDDSMDRVLPPFTPLETEKSDGKTVLKCFGRTYRYQKAPLPVSIGTAGVDDILAGPIVVEADGKVLRAKSLTVKKSSKTRDELVAQAESGKLSVTNSFWIEYDGLIYNTLELRAKTNVKNVTLRVPYKKNHAQYAHITESGFGAGGGFTRPIDKSFSVGFWPVVWIGDFERGLCWFAESNGDLRTTAKQPISIIKGNTNVTLRVSLADNLSAGKKITVRFGLIATPVKPLHPRYPLNIHAGFPSIFNQPPKRPLYSLVTWGEQIGFRDFKLYNPRSKKFYHPGEKLAEYAKRSRPAKVIPYMTPYTVPSEYPEANYYLREWEILPSKHTPSTRPLPGGASKPFTDYWMSTQSESYRRYYAYKVADMIKRTGIDGLYFDFGPACRDRNRYHGANGGVGLLAQRDFYRRIVNEFVKAGVEDYVIVVHNSMTIQIPSFTFVTHFFNGEQHRQASGSTLHEGRDYLDTLPLYYFGIEHSGMPWGIHGNMLPEFPEAEHLLAQINVKDETVTEYLWDRTSSIMMPILLHNCLPGGYRLSHYYYKKVYGVLEDFDVPTAVFHPYWRNKDLIEVDNPDFRVSFYTRPEAPRALLVVGNLNKKPGEVTIKLDMQRLYDWRKARGGMARVKKRSDLLQVVERLGARDARILEIGPRHVKLWVNGHSMGLVEVTGHQRLR